MPQYMVRVEIHNASRETYDRLHSAMDAESLGRVLTAEGSGKKSHMPTGTYWTDSYSDAWAVLEAAKRAALPIAANAEIVVSGGPQLVFYNCRPVPEFSLAAALLAAPPAPRRLGSLLGSIPEPETPNLATLLSLLGGTTK